MARCMRIAGLVAALMGLLGACSSGIYRTSRPFERQLAVNSPHDEPGGRFDGASVSPGVGVLYLNGYTDELSADEACGGYFGEAAEHILEVRFSMNLKLVVQSSDDLVLAVTNPDGTLTCWDATSSSNENVSLDQHFEPGRYDIFVGPTRLQTTSAYRLVLSE